MPPERRAGAPRAARSAADRGGRPASARSAAARPARGDYGDRSARSAGRGDVRSGGRLDARRDTTEKKEKAIYFTQLNFDETANDYIMTKGVIGVGIAILVLGLVTFTFNLGINWVIGFIIALIFWCAYFFSSLIMRPKLPYMPYQEKKNYWTYELTEEYKNRNVALNDFKRQIATNLIRPQDKVLIDDVSVELMSYDPLIFDFAIRTTVKKEDIMRKVPDWASMFNVETGTITSTGINNWRVVYPRRGKWETLAGRNVDRKDAIGDSKDISVTYNPIGVRTDNFKEISISNADVHTVITGSSGYGKSNTFNLMLSNQFPSNALILFFDKKELEAPAVNDRVFAVISYEQANAWIECISKEMSRRAQYLAKHGKAKLLPPEEAANDPDALPFTDEMPPIILAIDECGMWVATIGGKPAQDFRKFLEAVSRLGRATGITLICGSQSPRDGDIPDMVKRNTDQYIAYRQNAETQAMAIGKTKLEPQDAAPSEIPVKDPETPGSGGVGQFVFASALTDNQGVPVKGYYISKDDVIKAAKANKSKKPVNIEIVRMANVAYSNIKLNHPNPLTIPTSIFDPTIPAHVE